MSKRIAIYVVAAFILSVVSWALEASHYNTYLDLQELLYASAVLTLFAWGIGLWFTRKWWYQAELEGWQKLQRILVIGMIMLLIIPPLFSRSNRIGTEGKMVWTTVELQQEAARYQSRFGNADLQSSGPKPSQYLLFFYHKNRLYRVAYSEGPKFATQQSGDAISIPISPGRWGFAWVPIEAL